MRKRGTNPLFASQVNLKVCQKEPTTKKESLIQLSQKLGKIRQ